MHSDSIKSMLQDFRKTKCHSIKYVTHNDSCGIVFL
ncbi:hypothetical protein Salpa_3135 [Sporomusa sp. KB1]|nr:hypothetical protein Salpa_3135 [Sporomusa sp. KB1]